jgi:hypothetical protein
MSAEQTEGREWKRIVSKAAMIVGTGFILFSSHTGIGALLLVGGGAYTFLGRNEKNK